MAYEQRMTQAIPQVTETTKAVKMAFRETEIPVNTTRLVPPIPQISGPVLNKPMFDWKSPDKYLELHNFEIEIKNIFLTNSYNIQESKKCQLL